MLGREPRVSVCIPTYNRAEMLRESIESVLAQSFEDFELVVSDNASQDHTEQVVASFRDGRIRYVKQKINIGVVKNFNHCLSLAKGFYVTIFHDDDIMLPNNLLLKVRALDQNPAVGFVHSKFDVINQQGTILETSTNLGEPQASDLVERGHDFLTRNLLGVNLVILPTVMMRNECYSKLGGFTEKVVFTTDFEYWMRLSLYYDVMFLATPLLRIRRHAAAGTAQYTRYINGSVQLTVRGLEEVFVAKRLILQRSKYDLENWESIQRMVREWMISQMANRLPEEQLNKRFQRKAIARMCRLFPELLREKSTTKLLLRAYLGNRIVDSLKALVSRNRSK